MIPTALVDVWIVAMLSGQGSVNTQSNKQSYHSGHPFVVELKHPGKATLDLPYQCFKNKSWNDEIDTQINVNSAKVRVHTNL